MAIHFDRHRSLFEPPGAPQGPGYRRTCTFGLARLGRAYQRAAPTHVPVPMLSPRIRFPPSHPLIYARPDTCENK